MMLQSHKSLSSSRRETLDVTTAFASIALSRLLEMSSVLNTGVGAQGQRDCTKNELTSRADKDMQIVCIKANMGYNNEDGQPGALQLGSHMSPEFPVTGIRTKDKDQKKPEGRCFVIL